MQANTIYLVDDHTKSIFPDGNVQFSVDNQLTDGGHCEVVGESYSLETNQPRTAAKANAVIRPSTMAGSRSPAETPQTSFTFNRSRRRLSTNTSFNK